MLSKEELLKYNRHLIMPEIGLEGQEKIKLAKVLVIGAGGLGTPVLQYLTAAGVGTIGIVEYDTVSESNLQRQVLYSETDIGKPKIEIAKSKLEKLNSYIKIKLFNLKLTKENVLDIFPSFDVIIDTSDNFPTRYLVNDACVILNKPLVYGAIHKFLGQVAVFNYKGGPTYRCIFPEQPEEGEVPNCSTIGVLGAVPGVIGAMQAVEALKIVINNGNVLSGKLFQIDFLEFRTEIITIEKDSNFSNITELSEYENTCQSVDDRINTILVTELYSKIKNKENILIYDLRSPEQFKDYNIGGKNIEVEKFIFAPENLTKEKTVIFVCEFGEKSKTLTEYLQFEKGFTNVYNLEGGIQAWIKAGFSLR